MNLIGAISRSNAIGTVEEILSTVPESHKPFVNNDEWDYRLAQRGAIVKFLYMGSIAFETEGKQSIRKTTTLAIKE